MLIGKGSDSVRMDLTRSLHHPHSVQTRQKQCDVRSSCLGTISKNPHIQMLSGCEVSGAMHSTECGVT